MLRSIADSHEGAQSLTARASAGYQRAHPATGVLARLRVAAARLAMPRALWLCLALYALCNLGDLISTEIGLRAGLREGNPLMHALLLRSGFTALVGYKVFVVLAVVAGVAAIQRRHRRLALVTLAICTALVGLAVVLNVAQTVWM